MNAPVRDGEILAGKYRVERVLGVGGMGVVVAAHHLQLDEKVALKFLLPEALLAYLAAGPVSYVIAGAGLIQTGGSATGITQTNAAGGSETRPKNAAVSYIIKT